MAERSKAAVLKTVDRKVRGFESLSLRHAGQVKWSPFRQVILTTSSHTPTFTILRPDFERVDKIETPDLYEIVHVSCDERQSRIQSGCGYNGIR